MRIWKAEGYSGVLQPRAFSVLFAIVATISAIGCSHVVAATTSSTAGITISPAFQQITVAPDKQTVSSNFSVTNNSNTTYEFALSTVDFGSLDESGGVLFMGQSNRSLNYKYGLSHWVSLGQDRIVVSPGATVKVPITVNNEQSLAPGGHYGAVLISPADVDGHPSKVEINQVLSSLLFITKQGGEVYSMQLRDYSVKTHLFSSPSAVNLRFQNSGNVHVIPEGVAFITDPHGKVVKQGFINPGSAIILPESFRMLTIPLENRGVAWLPGHYHLHLAYRYSGQSREETRDVEFFYLNGWYVVAFMAVAAFIILMVISRTFHAKVMRIVRAVGHELRAVFRWKIRILRQIRKRIIR